MDELVAFLLERLGDLDLDQLDDHQPRMFAYGYMPQDRPGEYRIGHEPGCAACTDDPGKHGEAGFGNSWIEQWPCRHLCALALPFADDPGYHSWWGDRVGWGPRIVQD